MKRTTTLLLGAVVACAGCSSGGGASATLPATVAAPKAPSGIAQVVVTPTSVIFPSPKRASSRERSPAYVNAGNTGLYNQAFTVTTAAPGYAPYTQPDVAVAGGQQTIPIPVYSNTTNTITVDEWKRDFSGNHLAKIASGTTQVTTGSTVSAQTFNLTLNQVATQLGYSISGAQTLWAATGGSGFAFVNTTAARGTITTPTVATFCMSGTLPAQGTVLFSAADATGAIAASSGGTNFGLGAATIVPGSVGASTYTAGTTGQITNGSVTLYLNDPATTSPSAVQSAVQYNIAATGKLPQTVSIGVNIQDAFTGPTTYYLTLNFTIYC